MDCFKFLQITKINALMLYIKSIDLAILLTVCLTQEIVLQVSLYNKKPANVAFAFGAFSSSLKKRLFPLAIF